MLAFQFITYHSAFIVSLCLLCVLCVCGGEHHLTQDATEENLKCQHKVN
jgi:hypothetical protein